MRDTTKQQKIWSSMRCGRSFDQFFSSLLLFAVFALIAKSIWSKWKSNGHCLNDCWSIVASLRDCRASGSFSFAYHSKSNLIKEAVGNSAHHPAKIVAKSRFPINLRKREKFRSQNFWLARISHLLKTSCKPPSEHCTIPSWRSMNLTVPMKVLKK